MDCFDVAIIGGGVSGAAIARKMSAYKLKTVLLEKEADVSFGVSKANSGIIHGGFHHGKGALKSRLEIQGNLMFDQLKNELHFPFRRNGILVAAFNTEEMRTVEELYQNGLDNGAIGIELCSRSRILALEPKLNPDVAGGLHAPGGGMIEPYQFVYSLMESALKNGVRLMTDFKVSRAEERDGCYHITDESGRTIQSGWVVNAAGLYADEVSRIFGAEEYEIKPRKGEEFLLDRNASAFTQRVIFPVPSKVSKGMLVIPTVEGTTMVGPTAIIGDDKEDKATTQGNFEQVFYSARRLIPTVSEKDIITSFAGLRPVLEGNDFYIDLSGKAPRFIQVAGIQSPGLTAAPAIGEYVKNLLLKAGLLLEENPEYDPVIEAVPRFRGTEKKELDKLIAENLAYGEIVCRCENVSEAEIVAAIQRGHRTLDGIKFYTRARMGRCQGGFCTFRILQILQRETGQSIEDLTKRGKGSYLVHAKVGDMPVEEMV
jgi:glycerol-3-phosphate dehydrogenase